MKNKEKREGKQAKRRKIVKEIEGKEEKLLKRGETSDKELLFETLKLYKTLITNTGVYICPK